MVFEGIVLCETLSFMWQSLIWKKNDDPKNFAGEKESCETSYSGKQIGEKNILAKSFLRKIKIWSMKFYLMKLNVSGPTSYKDFSIT